MNPWQRQGRSHGMPQVRTNAAKAPRKTNKPDNRLELAWLTMPLDRFPLTPALSLGERGNRPPLVDEMDAPGCRAAAPVGQSAGSNGMVGKRWELSKDLPASLRCCARDGRAPGHRHLFAPI